MSIVKKTFPVTASDMDMDYHLALPGIMLYLQDTIQHFFAKYNLAAFDVDTLGKMWVISDYHMAIRHEKPFWGSSVSVELWASEVSPIRIYYDFRMKTDDGAILAEGNSTWAMIDAETFRPSPSSDLFAPIQTIDEKNLGGHSKVVFPALGDVAGEYTYTTRMIDVDFNSHISNRVYLTTALGGMPLDFERSHTPVSFYIRFIRQTHLGDTLVCTCHKVDKPSTALSESQYKRENFVHVIKNSSGEEVSRIWTCWEEQEVCHEAIRDAFVRLH